MTQLATTKEQSERLIKLGVPKETADMHYWQNHDNKWELRIGNGANFQVNRNRLVEAWSLSALLDLIVKHFWLCSTGHGVWHVKSLYYDDKEEPLETFITCSNAFTAVFTIIDKAPMTLLKYKI